MERSRDVLDFMFAQIVEGGRQVIAHRLLHDRRNRDTSGLCEPLQPRGNVDPIAIDRAIGLLDDVAEVHADAKSHAPIVRYPVRRRFDTLLDRQCGAHRASGGLEHRKHRITRHVDDAPLMRFDVDPEDAARSVERRDGRALVRGHQARELGRVRSQDRRQPLSYPRFAQNLS